MAEPRTFAEKMWAGFDRLLVLLGSLAAIVAAYYGKAAYDDAHAAQGVARSTHAAVAPWSHIVLSSAFLAVIYSVIAAGLISVAIAHIRQRRTTTGKATLSGAVGAALEPDTKRPSETHAQRSALETQFLRGKRWWTFWASPPFSLYQAKRRLEFIESWDKFFKERDALIAYSAEEPGRVFVENAVDYTVRLAPDAIYSLYITHHHMREMILAQLMKMSNSTDVP
jgi:hypothetical protein